MCLHIHIYHSIIVQLILFLIWLLGPKMLELTQKLYQVEVECLSDDIQLVMAMEQRCEFKQLPLNRLISNVSKIKAYRCHCISLYSWSELYYHQRKKVSVSESFWSFMSGVSIVELANLDISYVFIDSKTIEHSPLNYT